LTVKIANAFLKGV